MTTLTAMLIVAVGFFASTGRDPATEIRAGPTFGFPLSLFEVTPRTRRRRSRLDSYWRSRLSGWARQSRPTV